MVVVDGPGLQRPVQQGDVVDAAAVEVGAVPPRSPNHNAVCERFHGTVLREFR
jgi:hypothetical protein